MESTIDQILLMQDTIMDVRRRTQESTISEIVSRQIDPVLFIRLLTTDNFLALSCTTEHWEIVTYLTQLITSWSN